MRSRRDWRHGPSRISTWKAFGGLARRRWRVERLRLEQGTHEPHSSMPRKLSVETERIRMLDGLPNLERSTTSPGSWPLLDAHLDIGSSALHMAAPATGTPRPALSFAAQVYDDELLRDVAQAFRGAAPGAGAPPSSAAFAIPLRRRLRLADASDRLQLLVDGLRGSYRAEATCPLMFLGSSASSSSAAATSSIDTWPRTRR